MRSLRALRIIGIGLVLLWGLSGSFSFGEAAAQGQEPIKLPLHWFIFEDGMTTLAQNAQFKDENAVLGEPDEQVRQAIESSLLSEMNRIWSQCNLTLQLGLIKVVRPTKITLPDGRTLADTLFEQGGSRLFIGPGDGNGGFAALYLALSTIAQELQKEGLTVQRGDHQAFITGRTVAFTPDNTLTVDGHAFATGAPFFLLQVLNLPFTNRNFYVAAHELGHNLGLRHPQNYDSIEEPELAALQQQADNLMASGRNLVPIQCQIVQARLAPSPKQIRVPSGIIKTVQLGLDISVEGDTVVISAGRYKPTEHPGGRPEAIIRVKNKRNLIIAGEGAETTIVEGPLWIDGSQGITIQGVTITNSNNEGVSVFLNSKMTLTNSVINNNRGSGIFVGSGSSAEIANNAISQNVFAGIFVSSAEARITGNQITNTQPDSQGVGDGILANRNSRITVDGNTISRNARMGIALFSTTAAITNNTITDNGRFGIFADSNSTLTQCSGNTLSGNRQGNFGGIAAGRCQ